MNDTTKELGERFPRNSLVMGRVTKISDIGFEVFIDDETQGFVHRTEITWSTDLKNPSAYVSLDDEIEAVVVKWLDNNNTQLWLSMRECLPSPWDDFSRRHQKGDIVTGTVSAIVDYGVTVDIEAGINGLIFVNEMDWTNHNIHPSQLVSLGDTIDVMITDLDQEKGKMSLSYKALLPNPWEKFEKLHPPQTKVLGTVQSHSLLGPIIELQGGVTGILYLSESDDATIPDVGDELHLEVISVDSEQERISLKMAESE